MDLKAAEIYKYFNCLLYFMSVSKHIEKWKASKEDMLETLKLIF